MPPSTNQASSVDTEGQSIQNPQEVDGRKADNMAGQPSNETVTIILATTIPSVFLIIMAAVIFRRVRRRKARFLKRGITPIDDEEIESWRVGRTLDIDEKSLSLPISPITEPKRTHQPSSSVGSVQKPPSVIVYQNNDVGVHRESEDQTPWAYGKRSIDVPKTPILARAPNARPGLTDESVQGADAFVNVVTVKRQPSRLTKNPPGTPRHARSRSTRSSFGGNAGREPWYTQSPDQNSPRQSGDTYSKSSPSSRSGHRATLSSPTNVARDSYDEDVVLAGLSPRPLIHRSEIGRAIG